MYKAMILNTKGVSRMMDEVSKAKLATAGRE